MKTTFTSIFITLIVFQIYAQDTMRVHRNNGTVVKYPLTEVDSVTYIVAPKVKSAETIDAPLKIFVISDLNSSYGSTTYQAEVAYTINQIAIEKPDIVLCGGDMVAGQDNTLTQQQIRNMWAGFKTAILKPINDLHIPFGFTVGNHDASPSYLVDRQLANEFWMNKTDNPTNLTFVDSTNFPFYYSYIENNIFFMSWDAAGPTMTSVVQTWITNQCKLPIAKNARLRVLLGHLPLFPIVPKTNVSGEYLANVTLDFIKNNGIELYISGHQHAYYPAHKDGVDLLNLGCIGSGPRQYLNSVAPAAKTYTIIDIPVTLPKTFTYTTKNPTSKTQVDITTLPESITGIGGTVIRRDK